MSIVQFAKSSVHNEKIIRHNEMKNQNRNMVESRREKLEIIFVDSLKRSNEREKKPEK
jgi:hypothetical protein